MLIGSKLPPFHTDTTYFSLGRAAFAYLIKHQIRPHKVYLPSFTCWSLLSTMQHRFPEIELEFYSVNKDLSCNYPSVINDNELLVFIHFFGHENVTPLPKCNGGILLEDLSHSYMSNIQIKGDYIFGSLRKILKIGDGGFIRGFFNPIYEPSRKLDTWLRYESKDWRDVREAENMIDREWHIADISSQSLAIFLTSNQDLIRHKRQKNEQILYEGLKVGYPLITFRRYECPLIHNRIMPSEQERDSLRSYLAKSGVYTSIHWPTHELVKHSKSDIADTLWLESHIISIPVSHDYSENDMEYIVKKVEEWQAIN